MADERQFCTFFLADLFFGIEVTKVQEVIRYQEMTMVPLALGTVSGLINLRGQIVTALDLRRVLDFDDRPAQLLPMNVVIHTEDGAVSLLVDRIGDVLHINEDTYERPPETLTGIVRELIQGAYKLPNELLLVLDVDKIVSPDRADAYGGESLF